jgi:hypothetical protein
VPCTESLSNHSLLLAYLARGEPGSGRAPFAARNGNFRGRDRPRESYDVDFPETQRPSSSRAKHLECRWLYRVYYNIFNLGEWVVETRGLELRARHAVVSNHWISNIAGETQTIFLGQAARRLEVTGGSVPSRLPAGRTGTSPCPDDAWPRTRQPTPWKVWNSTPTLVTLCWPAGTRSIAGSGRTP